MGWLDSHPTKLARQITELAGKSGVLVEDNPQLGMLTIKLGGYKFDRDNTALIERARKIDAQCFGAKNDFEDRSVGNSDATYIVTIKAPAYEQVMPQLKQMLDEAGESLSIAHVEPPKITSFFQFAANHLEQLAFDVGSDQMLVITLRQKASLSQEERNFLATLGNPHTEDGVTRITVRDTGRTQTLVNQLEQLGVPVIRMETEKEAVPQWLEALQSLKKRDPQSFFVFRLPPRENRPNNLCLVTRDEATQDEIHSLLAEGHVRHQPSALSGDLKAFLSRKGVLQVDEYQQIMVADAKAVELIGKGFLRNSKTERE